MTASDTKQTSLLSDVPAKKDLLDYVAYRDALVTIIRNLNPETPLTIGVFGNWGSGKTTLLRMIAEELENPTIKDEQKSKPVPNIWVNVWELGTQDEVWNAFVQALLTEMRRNTPWLRRIRFDLKLLLERVKWTNAARQFLANLYRVVIAVTPLLLAQAVPTGGDLQKLIATSAPWLTGVLASWTILKPIANASRDAVSLDLGVLLEDAPFEEKVTTLRRLKGYFAKLVGARLDKGQHLAIFVDDLDRCQPDKVTQVLDAIKLFMDIPRCAYLVSLDRSIVEQAVAEKYANYTDRVLC